MSTIRLTEKSIAKIKAPHPSGKQQLFWDDKLRGFGVLVSGVTNSKTYIVQRAIRGRTRRITVGACNALKLTDAEDAAKKILATFYRGHDPKAGLRGDATLRSAMEEYLRVRTDLRPRSVDGYRDTVEKYLDTWLDLPLRTVTREMVEDRLKKIAKDVAKGGRHSGHATANGAMRSFRTIYNFTASRASTENPMPANPVKLKKVWFKVERRTRSVRAEELPKFYRSALKLTNAVGRDYILLLLFTGFRRGEAASLKWTDVDLKEKVIRLREESTKGKRKLELPMSDYVFKLLASRRRVGDAGWVFPAASKSGHIEEPRYFLDLIAEDSGIRVSAHDLRRTFTTVAESTEMSQLALKALINHSLGGDVTAGYVQMTADRLREPAQKVCNKLKDLCGIRIKGRGR